jgi:nucleotide-binding universal stress UspA family protein
MRVLFATDGSECAEDAARFLARLDFSEEDEIVVLYVVSDIPFEDDYEAQVKHAIRRVAPKILESSKRILKPLKAQIATLEREGYPDTTIVETAVGSGSDLIVMGARGIKGIKLLFLGSSTRAVAITSPKPLLVVKQPSWKPSGPFKLLFATDGSEAAEATSQLLSLLPVPPDSKATIVSVVRSGFVEVPEKYRSDVEEGLKEGYERASKTAMDTAVSAVERARAALAPKFTEMRIATPTGDPAAEILRIEKTMQPDVIAMGSRGLRGVKGMLGSVSRRVLGNADTSVLIGKSD